VKIRSIETRHTDSGWRNYHFVKLTTEDGVVGWSEYDEHQGAIGVTTVIEEEISGIEGVKSVRWSSQDGRSYINLEFDLGRDIDAAAILPPDEGFSLRSFLLQCVCTGAVLVTCAAVLRRGLRGGIEKASRFIVPALLGGLLILIVRSLTLPGAGEGLRWYLGAFDPGALTPPVMLGALGQAIFSLSLGGTFMVVYGSYLNRGDPLRGNAVFTAGGDLCAGLLAGLAIFPAVFAFGLEPASGPGLLFVTLPDVFGRIPAGAVFGTLFFLALFGGAYLSDVAALEVLVAGVTDNTGIGRSRAVTLTTVVVFAFALPPMINMNVFTPWDLTFGSGFQTLGALLSVVAVGWALDRSEVLRQLAAGEDGPRRRRVPTLWLYYWLRFVIPAAILAVGAWWLLRDVLGVTVGLASP